MMKHFKTRKDRKAWEELSPYLSVDLRRSEEWDIAFSSAEGDVLAWLIVNNFKVRRKRNSNEASR